MATQELKTRDQVEEKYTWNLKDMYESTDSWKKDIEAIKEIADKIASYEGKVCESAKNLLIVLKLQDEYGEKMLKAYEYANRLFDENQANSENQGYYQKMTSLWVECSSKISFMEPEVLALEESRLESYYKEENGLEFYRKAIEEIQRTKDHCLSAELEKVLAMTGEMQNAPSDIYSALTDVDFEFPVIKDENGEEVRITDGRFVHLLESADRRVRKDTFEGYYSVYKKFINTLAAAYTAETKRLDFNAKMRKYESSLVAAVDANNVSPKVYKNLVESVNNNLDKLHAYVSLRKKLLGVDELHMYDIYTPMISGVAKDISFDEAKETIIKALAVLGDDYVELLKEAFANRWCDVYENKGKRGGAYSATAYGCHPYMLLNYNGSLDNMFTVAHEMGHSMHSYYSNKAQAFRYADYTIFVAEVASTTNELLLLDYLLKNCSDKKEKAYLLNHYLDSFKGTVFRQTQFAEFEMKSKEMNEAGESLNAESLCKLYKEINEKYYGPDMISDDEISYEWARIPHFYYNYYVYQYSTSFCASVAISERIIKEGKPFVEQYKKFLSSGCTDAPVELLKIAGVDLTTAAPIEAALKKCGEIVKELEELTK